MTLLHQPRVVSNGHRDAVPDRGRVLLFDGNDRSVIAAAPALNGLGIEVVRTGSVPVTTSPRDLLAIVVSSTTNTQETTGLVRHLRTVSELPVLLLAPRVGDDALLQELPESDGGAFVPLELAQQIRAILRRTPSRVLRYGLLEIDTAAREVRVDRQPIELSRREFELIAFLASSPGQVFTRRELLDGVWHSSGEWQTESTVTEHVRRIRAKLQHRPDLPTWLITVRGTGYRFER